MMAKIQDDDFLDTLFGALSDRNRRGILNDLTQGESSVSILAKKYQISLPGVMKHLGILEKAKLITLHKDGRVRKCNFDPEGLKSADAYLDMYKQYWNKKLNELQDYLDDMD